MKVELWINGKGFLYLVCDEISLVIVPGQVSMRGIGHGDRIMGSFQEDVALIQTEGDRVAMTRINLTPQEWHERYAKSPAMRMVATCSDGRVRRAMKTPTFPHIAKYLGEEESIKSKAKSEARATVV